MRAFAIALALLWGLCVFLQSLPAGQSVGGRDTRPASPAPKGYELRKVRRFGHKVVAVRLQVLVA